jgi:hypothetical protein
VFLILKECSGILWAAVILDGNLMHTCISERHKSNIGYKREPPEWPIL